MELLAGPDERRPRRRPLLAGLLLVLLHGPTCLRAQSGVELAVEAEPVLRIGDALDAPLERSFAEITAIGVVGDSLLVLEGSANEIRVFDREGGFLGRIGRKGEGPGEFEWPTAMWVARDTIAVVDLKLRRETFFTLAGELVRTQPLGRLGGQPLAGSAAMRGATVVAETAVTIGSEIGAFPERSIVATHAGTGRVDTIARYATGYVPYRATGSFGFLAFRAGSEGDWAVAGDSLLAVVSGEPSVLRWRRARERGLELEGELTLPLRPEVFTRDDGQELLARTNAKLRADGEEPIPRSAAVDAPDHWGQVKQLVVSDREECWIQWNDPASDVDDVWFRVSLADPRPTRARLPAGFHMLAAHGDELYGYVLTSYDVPVLTVLRLRGGAS